MKTAVFGLGSMGYGIASSVLKAGHETFGFDPATEQLSKFVSEGGSTAPIAAIASELECVVVVSRRLCSHRLCDCCSGCGT